MNKPLELTAYPLDLGFPSGYVLPRDTRVTFRAANRMAHEKRFTPAELAAEAWAARAAFDRTSFNEISSGDEFSDKRWAYVTDRLNTLYRFATLPHYDEDQP